MILILMILSLKTDILIAFLVFAFINDGILLRFRIIFYYSSTSICFPKNPLIGFNVFPFRFAAIIFIICYLIIRYCK
jgi:hypothetical protein